MTEQPNPLWELVREWPHDTEYEDLLESIKRQSIVDSELGFMSIEGHTESKHSPSCRRCALEAQLRAWDKQLILYVDLDQVQRIRQHILGVPSEK